MNEEEDCEMSLEWQFQQRHYYRNKQLLIDIKIITYVREEKRINYINVNIK